MISEDKVMNNENQIDEKAQQKASEKEHLNNTEPVQNPDENINVKKEGLGPNTRRKR